MTTDDLNRLALRGLTSERLRELMELGDEHGCDVHLLGQGLRLFPKAERQP